MQHFFRRDPLRSSMCHPRSILQQYSNYTVTFGVDHVNCRHSVKSVQCTLDIPECFQTSYPSSIRSSEDSKATLNSHSPDLFSSKLNASRTLELIVYVDVWRGFATGIGISFIPTEESLRSHHQILTVFIRSPSTETLFTTAHSRSIRKENFH